MPIEITEVASANIVIPNFPALNNEQEMLRFLQSVNAFVTTEPILEGGISMNIHAERISVARTLDGRFTVRRDYPLSFNDLDRLAEVAALAIENTQTAEQLYAYGFNVEALCTQGSGKPSATYLAENFFDVDGLAQSGFGDFGSASAGMEFSNGSRRWRINIRVIENAFDAPNLFVALNYHHVGQPLPDRQMIKQRIVEAWNGIPELIGKWERTT